MPGTDDAESSAALYREYAANGSWLWNIPAWLADRWSADNWAWTAVTLSTGMKYGVGGKAGAAAKAGVCPEALSEAAGVERAAVDGVRSGQIIGRPIICELGDIDRLLAQYGPGPWEKWAANVGGIEIHWFKNPATGMIVEIKVVP